VREKSPTSIFTKFPSTGCQCCPWK